MRYLASVQSSKIGPHHKDLTSIFIKASGVLEELKKTGNLVGFSKRK